MRERAGLQGSQSRTSMKATMTEPTSTKAELSVAQSRREKDSPPFLVNLSISGARQGGLANTVTALPGRLSNASRCAHGAGRRAAPPAGPAL